MKIPSPEEIMDVYPPHWMSNRTFAMLVIFFLPVFIPYVILWLVGQIVYTIVAFPWYLCRDLWEHYKKSA